ncbi:MAG TPA: PEP-CTERM sorting domain-containing protein [Candidatus Acidoferrum sp.]|jgi:hypothetical protein
MRKCVSIAGTLLLGVLLFAQPSKADGVTTNYELTGGGWDITFSIPSTLAPTSVTNNMVTFSNVTGSFGFGGTYDFSTIEIATVGWAGHTNYWASGSQTHFLELVAPGLFTLNADGTVTLNTGTFMIGDYNSFNGAPLSFTLRVVDSPTVGTPEPASLILLGFGGLALGALRRRKAS